MTFSQQGIVVNRQLSHTYEQIQRIEAEITRMELQMHTEEDVRQVQRRLTELHRQAEQLNTEPVLGINAHAAGAAAAAASAVVIYILLRRRERRKGKTP